MFLQTFFPQIANIFSTLVDLPGLYHSATKDASEADKELIHELVQDYMHNPRSIILAVVSAKNDAANQIILSLVKKIPNGASRTLGIVTKPDCISAGDEDFWFKLATNKEVILDRGWHVTKNRSEDEAAYTIAERNEAEKAFFDRGRFKDLPRSSVGVEALRARLSTLLHRHLVQELPALKQEMKAKLRTTTDEIASLGERRGTLQEQKSMLTTVCQNINLIVRDALNGTYVDAFFNEGDMDASIYEGANVRRFRALIQELNHRFAENVRLRGEKYILRCEKPVVLNKKIPALREDRSPLDSIDTDDEGDSDDPDDDLPRPRELSQMDFTNWVKKVILQCRGHELPGHVNPIVTSRLFWEQSEPWQALAQDHVDQVRAMSKNFLQQVLDYAAPAEFKAPLEELVVSGVLEATLKDGQEELKKLLADKARHPR